MIRGLSTDRHENFALPSLAMFRQFHTLPVNGWFGAKLGLSLGRTLQIEELYGL